MLRKLLSWGIIICFLSLSIKVLKASQIPNLKEVLKTMTLEEKIGQLFMVGVGGSELSPPVKEMISKYYVGGIILYRHNLNSPEQIAKFCNQLQNEAMNNPPGIPLLISTDQEGGPSQNLFEPQSATATCGNMALGATQNPKQNTYQTYKLMAEELRAVGINMDLAPVVDVNCNPSNPIINIRSFGEKAELVAKLGKEAVKGLQENKVIATIKHFPGHGDTTVDSHKGLPRVDFPLKRLKEVELKPFKEAIEAGAQAVMTAHIVYPQLDQSNLPATLSPKILTGLLREEMKFEGVIITDGMEMEAIAKNYGEKEATIMAINAGADIILVCTSDLGKQKERIKAVIEAVKNKKISEERINQAVERILELKSKHGIWENPLVEEKEASLNLGTREHKSLAEKIAEESITLVRNKEHLIPIKSPTSKKIFVVSPKLNALEPTTSWRISMTNSLGEELSMFCRFISELKIDAHPTLEEIALVKTEAKKADLIIICTLSARKSFEQVSLVKEVMKLNLPLIVVALGMPYDLLDFPEVRTYLVTYGYRSCSISALAKVILGKIEVKGKLPVSLI